MNLDEILDRRGQWPLELSEIMGKPEKHCLFLFHCGSMNLNYLSGSFEEMSGYPKGEKGLGWAFWFSLIHPEDQPAVADGILKSYRKTKEHEFDLNKIHHTLDVEYRLRNANDEWVWIRDSRFLLYDDSGQEMILGTLLDITEERKKAETELANAGIDEICIGPAVQIALQFKHSNEKMWIRTPSHKIPQPRREALDLLTSREKEILQLIGEGFSTKLISHQLNISINTVETHRRHLLEKLQVKNSMELIKEASRIYWF